MLKLQFVTSEAQTDGPVASSGGLIDNFASFEEVIIQWLILLGFLTSNLRPPMC